jgi:hypothetical protein
MTTIKLKSHPYLKPFPLRRPTIAALRLLAARAAASRPVLRRALDVDSIGSGR